MGIKIDVTMVERILRNNVYLNDDAVEFVLKAISDAVEIANQPTPAAKISSSQKRLLRPEGGEPLCTKADPEENMKPEEVPYLPNHPYVYGVRTVEVNAPLLFHRIEGDYLSDSRKGILFRIKQSPIGSVDKWFPKSQLVYSNLQKCYYSPRWLMERNGLL